MANPFVTRSNVFGTVPTVSAIATSPFTTVETDPAAVLIDKLKWIADGQIAESVNAANWLGFAANAGQNSGANSIVGKNYEEPKAVKSTDFLSGVKLPAMPALPAVSDDFKINFDKLKIDAEKELEKLKNSWMAKYLPSDTNVTALNKLFNDVLDGTADKSAQKRLDDLAVETTVALSSVTSAAIAAVNTAVSSSKSNLTANFAASRVGISDALSLASDNTHNIAWANAKDQVVRESNRLEREAVSNFASRGFSLPAGVLSKQLDAQRQASLDATSELAAKQAIETQKQELSIAQQSIEAYLRLMESQANAEQSGYRAYVDSQLKTAEMSLDANKYNAEVAFKHIGLRIDLTKFSGELAVKYRLGVIEGINNLVSAYTRWWANSSDQVRSIASAQSSAQEAIVNYFRAAIQYADVGLKTELANNENSIRYTQTAANFIGQAVGHHVQAAIAAADVFSRTASAALGGLNGVASHSTQT